MPTTTFIESGTDATQDFSFWPSSAVTGAATLTSDATQKLDGLRSIKCLTANAGENAANITANNIFADAGTCVSAWFRFSIIPGAITQFMSAEQTGGGSMVLGIALKTDGTLRLGGRGTTQVDGTTVLQASIWYRVSLSFVITSISNYTAKVYINGKLEITMTNANGNLGLSGGVTGSLGINQSSQNGMSSPAAMTVWVDSIYVDNRSDQSDCGNVHITAKRPFSNGTTNGFTTQIGSGGSSYGSGHASQVNEQPLSTTNGWSMVGAGSAVTEEYTIEGRIAGDMDLTAATIVDFLGWVYAKALVGETASIIVAGATSNISLVNANTLFTKMAGSTTYPAGGTDIGIITTTALTTVSLYEAGIVVAYIPAPPIGKLLATKQGINRASTY